MVTRIGSLRSGVLIVEAYDVFNGLYIGVLELAKIFVHQVVAFYLVDCELGDFLYAMLPVYCQRLGLGVRCILISPIPSTIRGDTFLCTRHIHWDNFCSSILDQF